MNLAEAMKFVLKHKGQGIVSSFVKEDLKNLVKDFISEITTFTRQKKKRRKLRYKLSTLRHSTWAHLKELREIPGRYKFGLVTFKNDVLAELENIPEPKERAVFAFKILSSLTGFLLELFYGTKKGPTGGLWELKKRTRITQVVTSVLVLRLGHLLLLKFINEVEKVMTDEEEKKRLRFFKKIIQDQRADVELEQVHEDDRAFQIVDHLRNYILHGQKS